MKKNIFDYTQLSELTKRRIRRFSNTSRKRKNNTSDILLLIILANMNERLNTMFYLVSNNIYDGVYPLQRTFFEMFIAYQSMLNSDEKEKFMLFYVIKERYETSFKWHKLTSSTNSFSNLLDTWEKNIVEIEKNSQNSNLKNIKQRLKMQNSKLWFELASGKSFKDLSDEFSTNEDYYFCYDEPSNWVHAQRVDKNIDESSFNQKIASEYELYLYIGLFRSVYMMYNSICDFAEYQGITQSVLLSRYYDKFSVFENQLSSYMQPLFTQMGLSKEEKIELRKLLEKDVEQQTQQ